MLGQNVRNVSVRRDNRSGSASYTVTKFYKHHQSGISGSAQLEDFGRDSERIKKETRKYM